MGKEHVINTTIIKAGKSLRMTVDGKPDATENYLVLKDFDFVEITRLLDIDLAQWKTQQPSDLTEAMTKLSTYLLQEGYIKPLIAH